ncbi:MAG: ATP-binding protein [Lachnospiraceae bacterium]
MKQKINLSLMTLSVLAIFVTMFCLTSVYYNLFQEQVRKDLKIEARLLSETGISRLVENQGFIGDEEIRITWISQDGQVLYDNDVDTHYMTNHLDREEVKAAFETGSGESVRESDTMNMRTFYYAVLLEDGTVLRVATRARSLISVFFSAFPVMLLILLVILGLCLTLSHLLTRQLLEPIREMAEDLENVPATSTYSELSPFLDRIREQHEDILAAARSRQDFTANVSHELKTPITAISGYAELIENRMVDEKQQIKFAGDIRKNADRLVSLINDIIRLSELDYGGGTLDFTSVDLYEVAEERVELLRTNAGSKNVSLILEGSSCMVTSNRSLLIELIDNLVQNAIRYNTPNGYVNILVEQRDGNAVLQVSDTGIGIPKADQSRVFERFYRVDKSRSRETGGTGLGLAIVKHIVELHNGTIRLESEVGKGTQIRIEL